tara:strand:+ start:22702 stop:23709 length:1008 start_codon:yes stop_codon:yes gene_type:complete
MNEKDLIVKYFRPLAKSKESLKLTDDVAIIDTRLHDQLIVSQDSLVMGTHFLKNDDPYLIAKKSIRVNVSDIISKGAIPYGYFMSLGLDSTISEDWVERFSEGLKEDQTKYNICLLGGDTVSNPSGVFISINIIGKNKNNIIKRSTANPNDIIYVSGDIGNSNAGLRILNTNKDYKGFPLIEESDKDFLVNCYLLPDPPLSIHKIINKYATSSMDTTDGLINDLKTLARVSGLDASINKDQIPISNSVRRFINYSKEYGEILFNGIVLHGGDDYQTIFTIDEKNCSSLESFAKKIDLKITRIGNMGKKSKNTKVLDHFNQEIEDSAHSFQHFGSK